ncbi:hypothetical protein MGN70_010983 [Eutypa lata]|uniref:TMEM205-like domain-containing protein n=1 Tax=Eutypa lata (strain UCR-EL1) TaxID=1287681 RepID=M7TNR6_EUTLA|nr:hypothetical protein UCREL1_4619 [Eutypa lata UCREL1]KAI1247097.1 hypothetical protein MGN70_010983 [Eutypa lata]
MSLLFSPAPYHIISYGTLLGTQVFHTFINSVSSFRVLERPQFAILQRAVFPWYFGIQTVAPVVLALTYPGIGGRSVLAALEAGASVYDRSVAGVLQQPGAVLAPLAVACVTGLANWAYFLPETNKLTARRRVQETKDGKRSYDAPPHSEEMAALNKRFGQLHGLSSLLNVVTLVATVAYGFHLSSAFE